MEQSSMEKKLKSINDLLPLELIRAILRRVPIKHLGRIKCVSKLWNNLISDPDFFAPSHTCLFLRNNSHAYSVDLNALLQEDNDGVDAITISLPFKKKPHSQFHFLGSCRGFVLLHREPQSLILWNPLTDSSKKISYSHMVNAAISTRDYVRLVKDFCFVHDPLLHGFGYDASQDDYVVVVAYYGNDGENHFDLCCFKSNAWINLDAALPKRLDWYDRKPKGLFYNGAIHWSTYEYCNDILIFDLKERSFSKISVPRERDMFEPRLVLLGGCLALYVYEENTTEIWVMKEYKVQSSWTLYEIPLKSFKPLCLSANGDIIGRCYPSYGGIVFYIYNVSGELLKHVQYLFGKLSSIITSVVYANNLMAVSSNIKDKKMKKAKKGKEVIVKEGVEGHDNNSVMDDID